MEKRVYDLEIDEELERVAPPLAESELEILEDDIYECGCQFPLIVWGNIIVDGHNRYHICHKHGIPFAIEQIEFADKNEAKLWIIKNQLGRRNLKEFQRCEMVLPMEEALKEDAERRRKKAISTYRTTGEKVSTLTLSKKSRDIIAEMAGVSVGTLYKVKVIREKASDEQLDQLRRGEKSINYVFNKVMEKETKKEESTESTGVEDKTEEEEVTEDTGEEDDFSGLKEQLDYAFDNFLGELDYALSWFCGATATVENGKKVMGMLDELMKKAKLAVEKKMEESK